MRIHHNDNRRPAANDNERDFLDDAGARANERRRVRRIDRRAALARKSEWLAS